MGFFVYILTCADGSYYIGHTDDLERRVAAHAAGTHSRYTAVRRPVKVAFAEEFPSRDEAFARERQIKGWTRRKKEALIGAHWEDLKRYSAAFGTPSLRGSERAT